MRSGRTENSSNKRGDRRSGGGGPSVGVQRKCQYDVFFSRICFSSRVGAMDDPWQVLTLKIGAKGTG